MQTSVETPLLEAQAQLWKARAQAKQKWLERMLAEPAKNPQLGVQRAAWIKRALNMVKRGQAEIQYRSALMDAYAEHLTALEMMLMSAVEQKSASGENRTRQEA